MFKRGDKVRCIDISNLPRLDLKLELSQVYTVMEYFEQSKGIYIKVGNEYVWCYCHRFVKVQNEIEEDIYV